MLSLPRPFPRRSRGSGIPASAAPTTFRAGRTGPGPWRLPGTSSAPRVGGPCSLKRRNPFRFAVAWGEAVDLILDSASGSVGGHGPLLAPPASTPGAKTLLQAARTPRLCCRARSSCSQTKRLNPCRSLESLVARTPPWIWGSEIPGEASSLVAELALWQLQDSGWGRRPPYSHKHWCGRSNRPPRSARRQSRPSRL